MTNPDAFQPSPVESDLSDYPIRRTCGVCDTDCWEGVTKCEGCEDSWLCESCRGKLCQWCKAEEEEMAL